MHCETHSREPTNKNGLSCEHFGIQRNEFLLGLKKFSGQIVKHTFPNEAHIYNYLFHCII